MGSGCSDLFRVLPRFSLEFPAFLCCHTQPHSRTSASNHFSNTTLDMGSQSRAQRQASQQQRRRTWLTLLPLNAVRPRIDRPILHKSKPTARAVCLSKREVGTYKTQHNSSCSYSSNGHTSRPGYCVARSELQPISRETSAQTVSISENAGRKGINASHTQTNAAPVATGRPHGP